MSRHVKFYLTAILFYLMLNLLKAWPCWTKLLTMPRPHLYLRNCRTNFLARWEKGVRPPF